MTCSPTRLLRHAPEQQKNCAEALPALVHHRLAGEALPPAISSFWFHLFLHTVGRMQFLIKYMYDRQHMCCASNITTPPCLVLDMTQCSSSDSAENKSIVFQQHTVELHV